MSKKNKFLEIDDEIEVEKSIDDNSDIAKKIVEYAKKGDVANVNRYKRQLKLKEELKNETK